MGDVLLIWVFFFFAARRERKVVEGGESEGKGD
jgi:hypothetical protein